MNNPTDKKLTVAGERTQCPSCGQIIPLQSELAAHPSSGGEKWTPEYVESMVLDEGGGLDGKPLADAHNSTLQQSDK